MSNTFGTLDALSRIPAPIPETMSPREKVARTIFDHASYRFMMIGEVYPIADAILEALASSGDQLSGNPGQLKSGDHAELARLAEAATPGPWRDGPPAWFRGRTNDEDGKRPIQRPGRPGTMANVYGKENAAFIAAANPATVLALIAEVAALNDYGRSVAKEALGYRDRATEAERKLAEAGKLNERAAELMRLCTSPERFQNASTLSVFAQMRIWLSDLSKEAERG